jgi:tetratricopeptide (TPR) repeat protein
MEAHISAARDIISLKSFNSSSSSHPCPEQEEWLKLIAGLFESTTVARYLSLAAECPTCAERLRTASVYLAEGQPVSQLAGSDPEWQRQMALKMMTPPAARNSSKSRWWSYALPAAAASIAVITFVWWPKSHQQPDVNQLLVSATAYAGNRPNETRFPGSPYAVFHEQRSPVERSLASKSPLQEAQTAIQSLCDKDSASRNCRFYRAELDLLGGHCDLALHSLSEMPEKPESKDLLLIRGMAELEEAKREAGIDDSAANKLYAQAIEDFSQVLDKSPKDPAALFNRGLAYQKQKIENRAIEDFQELEKIEKDPGWLAEVRKNLEQLRKKKLQE